MQPGYQLQTVWDPITRIWHWLLALSVTIGWTIGEFRDFDTIQWHFYAGYVTGGLLLFRLIWGMVGPSEVRFKTLFCAPSSLFSYLRTLFKREPSGIAGHSPMGSLAVLTILLLLIVQFTTGLFAEDDDLFSEGPLASYVSSGVVGTATSLHLKGAKIILIVIGFHLAAMAFYYLWKRENLITAMFTGEKVVKTKS